MGELFFLTPRRAAPGPNSLNLHNPIELPTLDDRLPGGLAPLRRKPKSLDVGPTLFQPGSGKVISAQASGNRAPGADGDPAGGQGAAVTADVSQIRYVTDLLEDVPIDPDVVALARRIARRLSLRHRPQARSTERGSGKLTSVPYRYRSDEIDLDRTVEALVERPIPDDTDIVVRERLRSRRSVCLIVDVSGSMRGEKVKMAAATVAALSAELANDELAIVAFWSDAAVLSRLAEPIRPAKLLDQLLRIPARGLTNVHFGLEAALGELRRSSAPRRIAILLSDAVHNAGLDPRFVASSFDELHTLLQTDGENDESLGRDIARLGHGKFFRVRTHHDIAPALNKVLRH